MNNIYDNEGFFDKYAAMSRSQNGLTSSGEWHQLQPLFPDLTNKKVLDLGCGYGWHCKYSVERGASCVLGLDLSTKMIETACEKNADSKIEYRVCGLDAYDYPENTYDFVVSNLVLHYIEDLNEIFKNVNKTLTQHGVFLFNIEHPIFTAGINQDWFYDSQNLPQHWPIDNYFLTGERKTAFLGQEVFKQHHTLAQILNGLLNTGFVIEAVDEAKPSPEMLKIPGMSDELRRPMMLLVRAKKA